jgi:cytochrome c
MRFIMDSWTFNKISGAVLGTLLLVLGLGNLSGILFHVEKPDHEKPGYKVEVVEEAVAEGGTPVAATSFPDLMAKADATKGMKQFNACKSCHNPEKGAVTKTGPALWDVVERPIGSFPGFTYTAGFTEKASEKWTYENLNAFLTAPKAFMKGTKMAFGGIKNDAKRADLIAYLASLSDAPKPFPPAQ